MKKSPDVKCPRCRPYIGEKDPRCDEHEHFEEPCDEDKACYAIEDERSRKFQCFTEGT